MTFIHKDDAELELCYMIMKFRFNASSTVKISIKKPA